MIRVHPLPVRMATADDAPELARLSDQLGYPTNGAALADRLARVLAREEHRVFVVSDKESAALVGWIHAQVHESLESEAYVEISGMVVDQQHRRHGVGRMLIQVVEGWAKASGRRRVRVRSNVIRTETHGFYAHLGFQVLKAQTVFAKDV